MWIICRENLITLFVIIVAAQSNSMSYFYKIRMSYSDENENVTITEKELQHAYYAFLSETRMILPNGEAIRGKDIISITPDLVRSMGWNHGYKPNSEDWRDMENKLGNRVNELAQREKETVLHLMETGKTALIGKNKDILLLDN